MSGRVLLNAVRVLLIDRIGLERYQRMVDPPTHEERALERLDELRAAGVPVKVA